MPRQTRLDSPGTLHHVMIRGIERRRIVNDEQDRRDFVLRLGKLVRDADIGLRVGPDEQSCPYTFEQWSAGVGEIHAAFYDRVCSELQLAPSPVRPCVSESIQIDRVRWGRYFTELVRYIHLNPLRAKLVADLKNWRNARTAGTGVNGESHHSLAGSNDPIYAPACRFDCTGVWRSLLRRAAVPS